VALLGVDSVMAPLALRQRAWERLARDLRPELLDTMTTEVDLAGALPIAQQLMAGQVRGRTVVKIG
jgi:acrylyl-CoA reductase (NADPH)